jgi:peptidoglycan/xylan/chitin deacetylase (PgdA/CDA1 family)
VFPAANILTYHSQNINFPRPGVNDHQALADDLEAVHQAGYRVRPLQHLADLLDGAAPAQPAEAVVYLTFDDGCDMDVHDIDYPGAGPQRSFLGVLQDFRARHGSAAQPGLHASSFVIASPQARAAIDAEALSGRGWISDGWWRAANDSGLLAIENHGWDHFHPATRPAGDSHLQVATSEQECQLQVLQAGRYIERHSGRQPQFFAYPFGYTGEYLPLQYFPDQRHGHGIRAAFGTAPGRVSAASDRWQLPRWVCGRDWHSSDELLAILRGDG